jgi:hypothetical protein
MKLRALALALLLVFCSLAALAADTVPTPSQFLGFEVGADRQLADYKQIVAYFNELAKHSGRIQVENLGKTTLGNDFILAAISSEANLKNKKRYQEIARKLADPRGLSQKQIDDLAREGKAILIITCNIHSTEIGASQMAMEWAYALVTATDPVTVQRLNNVILLLAPSINPDGQIMETEWYRKNLGTKYEGSRMPWLYHPYVGHDNNRDWYMLTQKESQVLTRAVYHEWFPQVWLDEHQMGSTGPRIFMPPYADPVAKNINPMVFRGTNLIGTTMAYRLEEQKKSGVIYGAMYDAYWPGGTKNTAWFKNVVGLLTEVASARLATPINVSPTELTGASKGLVEYVQTTNYLNPWPGGTWRMRDIMDYERIASDAILESVSDHAFDFQRNEAQMALDAVKAGAQDAYRIPKEQRDRTAAMRLVQLMREHGVEVFAGNDAYWIPLDQPYGKFADEMLAPTHYPKVKAVPGPNIIAPYDVAAWSLPLMMGVTANRMTPPAEERSKEWHPLTDADFPQGTVTGSGTIYALKHDENSAFKLVNAVLKANGKVSVAPRQSAAFAAGTFFIQSPDATALAKKYQLTLAAVPQLPEGAVAMKNLRVGLLKPWAAQLDEGWTRFLLEQYGFNPQSLDNKAVRAGNLKASFDVIVIPDMAKDIIVEGRQQQRGEGAAMRYFQDFPPEYSGGIGNEGVNALKRFVDDGGAIVAWGSGGDLLADEFNIPVVNELRSARAEDFLCPGSLLRVQLDNSHPVNWGMPEETAAFVDHGIAYRTTIPGADMERSVLAWYPADADDILLSGWIRGAERLQRKAAAVAFTRGKGKLVMIGFRPQFRAQTEATYKIVFNAIYWGGM